VGSSVRVAAGLRFGNGTDMRQSTTK
jgi:hypothetical protein